MASTDIILHGRRTGKSKSSLDLIGPNNVDLRQVKILSRDDWARIQNQLHRKEIEAERRRSEKLKNEEQRNLSKEIVKNWPNTILGARQRKLEERTKRLAEEENQRITQDLEEAELKAQKRKEMIEQAKTLQYYQTDRVKGFHRALQLTEVLKEREAQLELKRLKEQALAGQDDDTLYVAQKEYEDSLLKDQEKALARIQLARETAKYQKLQIQRNMQQAQEEHSLELQEGEELRRLAVAHALEKKRLEQIGRQEQRHMMVQNLRQIEDVKKMAEIQSLQSQEEDEECRIFAAAKKKMMRLRAEKERSLHEEKQRSLNVIKDKLSAQLQALINDEEDRLFNAVEEREHKLATEEEEKRRKAAEMRASIDKFRREQNEKMEREVREQRMKDLEMIRARKEADELFMQNERLRRKKAFEQAQQLSNYQLQQKEEVLNNEQQAIKEQLVYDNENVKLIEVEERQFQEYAKKVIDHAKKGGRNTYALERAATDGAGGGLGPVFPGKGGVRPSYLTSDHRGTQLPNYSRGSTKEVKIAIQGEAPTQNRMGFVW